MRLFASVSMLLCTLMTILTSNPVYARLNKIDWDSILPSPAEAVQERQQLEVYAAIFDGGIEFSMPSNLRSWQFTLETGGLVVDLIEPLSMNLAESDFQYDKALSLITSSWQGVQPARFRIYFSDPNRVRMDKDSIRFSNLILPSTGLDFHNTPFSLTIKWVEPVGSAEFDRLNAPLPNPFSNWVNIPFYLEKEGFATLNIIHSSGQIIWSDTQFYRFGEHRYNITDAIFGPKTGLFLIQFVTDNYVGARQIIRK